MAEPETPAPGLPVEPTVAAIPAVSPPVEVVAPVAIEPAPAPVAEAPAAVEPVAEKPTQEPSLLEKFDQAAAEKPETKPEAEKPADPAAKPEDAPKPDDKPAEAAPVDAPLTYTEFELPEGLAADAEKMSAYTGLLGKYRVPQEAGQELIALHADAMRTYADHLAKEQWRVFGETRQQWRDQVMAHPELGGSGHQTAMGAVARMRDLLVPKEERAQFDEMLRVTGAGDHPVFLGMLHRAARYFDEPKPVAGGKPTPSNGQRPIRGLRDIYRETAEAKGS